MAALHFAEPPKSLCLLRLSAIGDVTHVLPIIATLRQVWPQTRITWIIGALEYELVKSLKDIEFIVFNKKNGWRELLVLRKRLAGRQFDVLLMMQVALRANILSLAILARHKLGYDSARSRDFHSLFINQRIEGPHRVHVLDTFFQFLEKMGIQERRMDWLIKATTEAQQFAKTHLKGRPSVVINPCSSARANNWRNWSSENYARVCDYLDTKDIQVILTGGPSSMEIDFSNEIKKKSQCQPLNLVGKTSLQELLALMEQSMCIIAPDTGPAHMGTVAGIPVIGLYASSNPKRTGPYCSLNHSINRYPEALDTFHQKTEDEVSWGKRVRNPAVMDIISADEVLERINKCLPLN